MHYNAMQCNATGMGRVHSGQPADPSNDADRAIAGRKTGAAIQLTKTLASNAKYKSRCKYISKYKHKYKDRAIAGRKTGAAIQLQLTKTLASNAKYKYKSKDKC